IDVGDFAEGIAPPPLLPLWEKVDRRGAPRRMRGVGKNAAFASFADAAPTSAAEKRQLARRLRRKSMRRLQ
ncbi:MAG: hypothetical protein ACTHLP_06785, partial [Rhizobiaceae bacterium]